MACDLEGTVAVVTGGGSGIGRACALRLAQDGAAVAILDVDACSARAVAQETKAVGAPALDVACDVSDESQVEAAFALVSRELGIAEALVTSAGIVSFSQAAETGLDEWQSVIDVNLTGTFLAVKHALPGMVERGGGSIVTIGSVSALVAGNIDVGPAYKASKGGVLQLTKLVAAQYAHCGVRVNCLCPGPIAATTILAAGDAGAEEEENFARLAGGVPMGRGGQPEEVGAVASFLVSSDSSFMTGSAVVADGGYTAI
jgi:NAD(P)-dependent dehydrogenase (short-subunit alcohol dehydrogenase family)